MQSPTGYFPRLVLVLPHVLLISVLLATYPNSSSLATRSEAGAPVAPPKEGSVDWQANLQAIQNLMGA
jgi:hypothetical protein